MNSKNEHYFKIDAEKKFKLADIPSNTKRHYKSDKQYRQTLDDDRTLLAEFQTLLYAGHRRAMLIIFQGMDTAGKDGAIKHVMSGVNPQGVSVVSFKTPTSNELDHDFLWRINRELPARGQIGIFNRSYYEETLITQVHPEILEKEKIPGAKKHDDEFWEFRYHDIQNYEKYLHRQGYEIVKIFIHISCDEQLRRLKDRFRDPKKLWKISEGDVRERGYWNEYQAAYEECLRRTASKSAPWYIVPGDDKKNARLCVIQILLSRFEKMQLEYPKLNSEEKAALKKLKVRLDKG